MAMLVALALEAWERSANAATGILEQGIELGNFAKGAAGEIAFDRGGDVVVAEELLGYVRNAAEARLVHRHIVRSTNEFNTADGERKWAKRGHNALRRQDDAVRADAAAAGCISRWFQVVACLAGLGAASG
ncbi:hypothetical protein, partial [Mycobacterium sp. 050134]|uniref:hypothetical protein n=1 Tax=Mycobacterium sp. 050134 TaxID=3096111 RepID=UPI002ED7873B